MWAVLCTDGENSGAAMCFPYTAARHPQRPNKANTVINAVIHNPHTALAAPSPAHPQYAQHLILLLRYLRWFFFEVQRWGRGLRRHRGTRRRRGLSAVTISFQDGRRSSTVVLRLLATGG
jgi:hypothetical protein